MSLLSFRLPRLCRSLSLQARLDLVALAFNSGILAQLVGHRGTKYSHGDRALVSLATSLRLGARQLLQRASDPKGEFVGDFKPSQNCVDIIGKSSGTKQHLASHTFPSRANSC